MTIQAVFFDMGGTIQTFWHTRELRLKATLDLQKHLQSSGIDLHLSDEQLYEVVAGGLARYHRWAIKTLDETPALQFWNEYILAGYPVEPLRQAAAAEELMFFVETHFYKREMRPEMPAVLESIRKMGLKMGVISNVHSRGQVPANLEEYGIRQYFDPIVLSCEYGRRKPDPAIFHYAARLAHAPTSKCVYVGDRVARDILGARKAGYGLAIQIRHDFDHGEDDRGAHPDAYINQMTELVGILRHELDRSANESSSQPVNAHPVRAFLFDAGDILYYRPQRNLEFKVFLEQLSLDSECIQAAEKKILTDQAFTGQISQDQFREGVLRLYGVTQPDQIERGKRILDADDNDIQFFTGVPETLAVLKQQGFMLGVVTDTAASLTLKLSWFERGGFGDVWDAVISSKELGIRKPDARIYLAALQQLGLQPAEAIFVGHSAIELQGAREVGLNTVAFNYDPVAVADDYIDHFTDLLSLALISHREQEHQ
jgi:putative hydrolase of the HAD superfamily